MDGGSDIDGYNCNKAESVVTGDTINTVACSKEATIVSGDTAGNNCKLVHNRIQDTVAPFLVTVTIGLYGYEANNGIWGYVASGELAPEASLCQRSAAGPQSECSSASGIWEANSALVFIKIVMCAAVNLESE
jgi:hypothetical protein